MYHKFSAKFNNISFTIIMLVSALLPFFFLPAQLGGLGAVKGVLLYVGVFLAFSFWLVAQFIDGSLKVPKHRALLILALWVVLALVSALMSQNVTLSLWGRGFSVDSFATVLVLSLFAFMVASYAREQRKLVKLFLAAFSGSVITILLQILLFLSKGSTFVATHLSHVATQGTLVGSWVDFAHFVTFTFLLGLLMYEVLIPKGFFKFLSLIAMVLSLITLIFLNFKAAWIVTIVSALLVFVYKSSVERSLSKFVPKVGDITEEDENNAEVQAPDKGPQRFPVMSFIALLVGLFFFLSSGSIGASLSQSVGVNFTDIRPSFTTTTQVMRATLAQDPLFGAGAGRYGDVWNLYHPVEINQTPFWNTSFETGFSMLQALFTTNGILPTLAFMLVLVVTLIAGFRLFNYQFPDRFSRFIAVTALIMLIAFISLFLLTSPGMVLIVFGFMYLGLLLGVSTLVGKTQVLSLNYLRDPRTSFFAILILVVATMIGFSAAYFSGNRFASIVSYNRALAANDVTLAGTRLDRALSLSQNDIYWRTRTALYTNQFTALAATESPDKAQLQTLFSQAEQSATAAVAWDSGNANNWLMLSQVYQLLAGGDSVEPYENAKRAADEAQTRNPNNPLFSLNQAQLALTKQDAEGALTSIERAIALKADYLDAYVLRAQIRLARGVTDAAKTELLTYTAVAPFDDQGFVLLGSALLGLKENEAAVDAFARAKELAPNNPNNYLQYINALEVAGNRSQAVEELKLFKVRFPGVTGVDEQITRLQGQPTVTPAAPVDDASETPEVAN